MHGFRFFALRLEKEQSGKTTRHSRQKDYLLSWIRQSLTNEAPTQPAKIRLFPTCSNQWNPFLKKNLAWKAETENSVSTPAVTEGPPPSARGASWATGF